MQARDLMAMVAERHTKDLFIGECKNGPTWYGEHLRLDAWAMNRSWANACTYGYEIKVSRGDWTRDQKLNGYLEYCNCFYVVSAAGVVKESELPESAGWLEASKTGSRLFMRRKAVYRAVPLNENLVRYILMSRVKPCSRWQQLNGDEQSAADRLRNWVGDKENKRMLGADVSAKIHQVVAKMEVECIRLRKQNESYDDLRQMLRELDLNPESPGSWGVRQRLEQVKRAVPPRLRADLEITSDSILRLLGELDKLDKAATGGGEG